MESSLLQTWDNWKDCHSSVDQKKRYEYAKSAELTPVSIDILSGKGKFSGKHGKYSTSLESCECFDFNARQLPCKHMYRLALELRVIIDIFNSNSSKVKSPHPQDSFSLSESVAVLESCSKKAQMEVQNLFYNFLSSKTVVYPLASGTEATELLEKGIIVQVDDVKVSLSGYARNDLRTKIEPYTRNMKFNKNMKLSLLIDWVIINIPEALSDLCKEYIPASLHPRFLKSKQKLYTYLNRKYRTESIFDGDNLIELPYGAQVFTTITINPITKEKECLTSYRFPDDEITDLLNKYNANRCIEGSLN